MNELLYFIGGKVGLGKDESDYKSEIYLFNPRIDHNWYGVVSVKIIYYDENGELHNCEVI